MTVLSRLYTLISETWYTTYSAPVLLIPGLILALILTFEDSFFSPLEDILKRILEEGTLSEMYLRPSFIILCIILCTALFKTIAMSQIFVTAASHIFHRPSLLSLTKRYRVAFLYTTIELLTLLVLLAASLPLFLPFLFRTNHQTGFILTILITITFTLLFVIIAALSTIKRLTLGYLILSPISFRTALDLSARLFIRHQCFSILAFLFITLSSLLFTFLQTLVMIQGAFLNQWWVTNILGTTLSYSAVVLMSTFWVVFLEVFWVHFFLTLTNKRREADTIPLFLPESTPDIPHVL